MSYSSRRRYKTRREKIKMAGRKAKVSLVFIMIALAILLFKYWVPLRDYLMTYFY